MAAQLSRGVLPHHGAAIGPAAQQSPVNILLVDDEPKNLVALEAIVQADDRRLVRATSAQEALRCLLNEDFAVVLLDVHMPIMSGFELAELIRERERSHNTPIIFLTAASRDESFVAQGYALGAVDYIVKPLDPAILQSKVAVFVELFRKTEEIRHQAEMLEATSAFLQSVLGSATGYAIMALSEDAEILSWNEGARIMFGYEADEMVGSGYLAALVQTDDQEPGDLAKLLELASREPRVVGELECVRKSGQVFSAAITLDQRETPESAPGSGVTGYVAIIQDVTIRKQAELQRIRLYQEQVARAEAEAGRDRLQQVLDVLPEGILISDADGRILMSNSAAREIFGHDPSHASSLHENGRRRLRLDGSECALEEYPLMRATRGELVRGEQYIFEDVSTQTRMPVLISAAPLTYADGSVTGAVAAYQDITPIKELERQKDAFLAAASHDLTSPLTIVKARAQLLARQASRLSGPEVESFVEGLRTIDDTTRRLSSMVNELLDVARLEMGRPIEIQPRPVDLVELAREVTNSLAASSDRHQLLIESVDPSIEGIWDRQRLERVLTNLITNAIKYSPRGGEVTVRVSQETDRVARWARIDVEDHGVGIPRDERARIFERFYRARNVAGRIDGAGVGLSGVRHMVELHGGTISVESTEGKGSTFTVRLPIADEVAA